LPDDTPDERRRELLAGQRRVAMLDAWTDTSRAALKGLSPLEASADPAMRIPLFASVLLVEQAIADLEEQPLLDELREKLKLPARSTIDVAGMNIQRIPLVRVPRLDVTSMPDDRLAQLLDRSVMSGAIAAILTVATELVNRETVSEDVDQAVAYRQLIRATTDPRNSLQWVGRARAWSRQRGDSEAEWAVRELELSLELRDSERMGRVLDELRDKHLDVPGVGESVYRLLQDAGIVPPADAVQHAAGSIPAPHSGGRPARSGPSAAHEESKSVIWTP